MELLVSTASRYSCQAIKVLVNEKNLEKIKKLFPKKKIIKIDKNLAEINMHLHPEVVNTPGIIAIISNELAMNDVILWKL